jgi:hypothetical protein
MLGEGFRYAKHAIVHAKYASMLGGYRFRCTYAALPLSLEGNRHFLSPFEVAKGSTIAGKPEDEEQNCFRFGLSTL